MSTTLYNFVLGAVACLLLLVISVPTETKAARIQTHSPEWTDHNQGDPATVDSVAEDLQKVVVLCATQPQSKTFDRAWVNYLQRHKVAANQVDLLITEIMRRAERHRATHNIRPKPKEQTVDRMKRIAERLRHKNR